MRLLPTLGALQALPTSSETADETGVDRRRTSVEALTRERNRGLRLDVL